MMELNQWEGMRSWKVVRKLMSTVLMDKWSGSRKGSRMGKQRKSPTKWSAKEDRDLWKLVRQFGAKHWTMIGGKMHGKTGKQCRERWRNQLDPKICKEPWNTDEDLILQKAHAIYGNRWSMIATLLPGRTDNSVKNRWNSSPHRNVLGNSPERATRDYGVGYVDSKVHPSNQSEEKMEAKESLNILADVADMLQATTKV